MTEHTFIISIENFNYTVNQLHNLLSKRNVKVKKSDLKEVTSDLLGFVSSNVCDHKIKELKQQKLAQSPYKKNGRHKENHNLILNTSDNPLKIHDFFNKHVSYTTIVTFSGEFETSSGYIYKVGDVLFAKEKFGAIKTLLNWENTTKIEFVYFKDQEHYDCDDGKEGGYWELTFIGDGDEQYLGNYGDRYLNTLNAGDDINLPSADLDCVSNYFLTEVAEYQDAFHIDNREGFNSYLRDWIMEYYADNFLTKDAVEFKKYVETFIPYIGVQEIAGMEVGESPVEYLKILKSYGASYSHINLLIQALRSGCIDTCYFLIGQGNLIKNLFEKNSSRITTTHYHNEACTDDLDESIKTFYSTTQKIGIPLDSFDSDNNTPLHFAAMYENVDLYHWLINQGADTKIKNKNGETPENIMIRNK